MVLEFLFSQPVLSQIWKKQSRFFFFHWKNLLINVIFILYTINQILKPQVRQFIHYVKNFYTEN